MLGGASFAGRSGWGAGASIRTSSANAGATSSAVRRNVAPRLSHRMVLSFYRIIRRAATSNTRLWYKLAFSRKEIGDDGRRTTLRTDDPDHGWGERYRRGLRRAAGRRRRPRAPR